jgi:dethiobiotin synthetase
MSNSELSAIPASAQPSCGKPGDLLPIPGLFFTGTDTEVGKTYQAAQLVQCLRQRQVRVGVYKPVLSGLALPTASGLEPPEDDAAILAKAAGLDKAMIPRISPQRFAAPLAPPLAAQREGRCVDQQLLYSGALWWLDQCDFLVVEGAGGLMSPVSNGLTVIDLAQQFGFPVVLVAANRLGCISHILLAVEALQRRSMDLLAIVLNRFDDRCLLAADGQQRMDWLEETACGNLALLKELLPNVPLVEQAESLLDLLNPPNASSSLNFRAGR